jgi:hypothetical protein
MVSLERGSHGLPTLLARFTYYKYLFLDVIVYCGVVAVADRGTLRGSSGGGFRLVRLEMQHAPAHR